jgi:hypothetical protein
MVNFVVSMHERVSKLEGKSPAETAQPYMDRGLAFEPPTPEPAEESSTAEALADKEKKDAEFNAKVETVMREDGISWKAAAKKVNS